MTPGVPRKICLRFACNQTPANGADVVALRNRQAIVERTAGASGHEFRTDDRPTGRLQFSNPGLKLFRPSVVVERNDIRLLQLDLGGGTHLRRVRPVALPNATR